MPHSPRSSSHVANLKAKLRRFWLRLRGDASTPLRGAISVGIGAFIGCLPLYGLHLPLCALICLPLRLDLPLCYLAANISNPLFAPALITAELHIGSYLLTGEATAPNQGGDAERVALFFKEIFLGSLVLGAGAGILLGGLTYGVRKLRAQKLPPELQRAIKRCVARYQAAPRRHRYYVSTKLQYDPLSQRLMSFGQLGDILDLGCGRGQLCLLAFELQLTERVHGLDFDAEKIQIARRAAGADASFEYASFEEEGWTHQLPPLKSQSSRAPRDTPAGAAYDTLLLMDVLHYLPLAVQQRLIAQAYSLTKPGGKLIARVTRVDHGTSSRLTRAAEYIGRLLRINHAKRFHFLPTEQIEAMLVEAGFHLEPEEDPDQLLLSHAVLIAKKPAL